MKREQIIREMDRCERIMDIWFRVLVVAQVFNALAAVAMIVEVLRK